MLKIKSVPTGVWKKMTWRLNVYKMRGKIINTPFEIWKGTVLENRSKRNNSLGEKVIIFREC